MKHLDPAELLNSSPKEYAETKEWLFQEQWRIVLGPLKRLSFIGLSLIDPDGILHPKVRPKASGVYDNFEKKLCTEAFEQGFHYQGFFKSYLHFEGTLHQVYPELSSFVGDGP